MKKGKTMKMSTLCVTILAAAVYCGAFAALGDSLGNIGDVRLKGRLGERLDAMIEKHVAARAWKRPRRRAGGRPSSGGSGCTPLCRMRSWSWRVVG